MKTAEQINNTRQYKEASIDELNRTYKNNNNNNNDCNWYSDPESDSQRELKAAYSVRCRPTGQFNLYQTPGPGVEPGFSALKASVLPLGHRGKLEYKRMKVVERTA